MRSAWCVRSLVARHPRDWGKEHVVYNPVHYLALLERKPGGLDFAKPLENWDLPECFGVLRRRLETEREGEGTREFIKVLRLLEHADPCELGKAIDYALDIGTTEADAVRLILEHRRNNRSSCSAWTAGRIWLTSSSSRRIECLSNLVDGGLNHVEERG